MVFHRSFKPLKEISPKEQRVWSRTFYIYIGFYFNFPDRSPYADVLFSFSRCVFRVVSHQPMSLCKTGMFLIWSIFFMRLHCVRSCVADLRVDKQQSPPRMTRKFELAAVFNDEVVLLICCCRKFWCCRKSSCWQDFCSIGSWAKYFVDDIHCFVYNNLWWRSSAVSGRALVAAPVWVLSYINWLFGSTNLSKCVLYQYFPFPSALCSILCGQLSISSLDVFRLVQFIFVISSVISICHHPLYAGGVVSLWALEVQARPPLLPEATYSYLSHNQRSRHRREAYTSWLQGWEECKKSTIIEEVCFPRPYQCKICQ